jgi:hypothetical protein
MPSKFSYVTVSHQSLLKPMALAALWRHRAAKELRLWQQWLADEGMLSELAASSLLYALDHLNKTRFTVAVVADLSRGKSELINAMLFAEHGRRIVPAGAGRTTMCPTEFFCDENRPQFLELLPMETKLQDAPLSELYSDTRVWQRFELVDGDSQGFANLLLKVSETQKTTLAQAQLLGFATDEFVAVADEAEGLVEVPRWRYARVNVHHPLLTTGLAILDTPGLNALGYEPELTYSVLPTVDAVIYLVSADSGVTRTDQLTWHQHLNHLQTQNKMVVLNKIDMLNDGLRTALETQTDILQQVERCAAALEVSKKQVFAISARGALTARIAQDDGLLMQSRLPLLEAALTTHLVGKQQTSVKLHALDALKQSHHICAREIKGAILQLKTQLDELAGLSASNNPEQTLDAYASTTKKSYVLEAALSQSIDQTMAMHAARQSEILSVHEFQNLFEEPIKLCQSASVSAVKQQLQASILAVHARIKLASEESQYPLMSAKSALEKVNKLNGIVVEMGDSLSPQLSQTLDFSAMLNELSRMAKTCGAQLPSLPLLSSAQRAKAAQVVSAMCLRCVQMAAESSRLCEQWLAGLTEPIHHALKLHQALLLKRTDTLERMKQAQQALVEHVGTLNAQLAVCEQQLRRLNERCEAAAIVVTEDQTFQLMSA